jgi:hypothetical protein
MSKTTLLLYGCLVALVYGVGLFMTYREFHRHRTGGPRGE